MSRLGCYLNGSFIVYLFVPRVLPWTILLQPVLASARWGFRILGLQISLRHPGPWRVL